MLAMLLVAGLINWLATTVIVEGKIFEPVRSRARGEYARYFIGCHLCAGVWVGFIEAVVYMAFGAAFPFTSWWLVLANGLAFKAVGHLTLLVVNLGNAVIDYLKDGGNMKIIEVPGTEGAPVPVPVYASQATDPFNPG
jgi:hypothetical protein